MAIAEKALLPAESEDILFCADLKGTRPIRGQLFGLDHLDVYARRLARAVSDTQVKPGQPMLKAFDRNAEKLVQAHRIISEANHDQEVLGHDAEWLLDNFHIVAQALGEIRTDLPRGYYELLPKLARGPLRGWPRVYALAFAIVAHCDSGLDESHLARFLEAFQTVTPLNVGELWAFPIMLRLCLVDNLRRLAEQIVQFRHHRQRVQQWLKEHVPNLAGAGEDDLFELDSIHPDWRDCYVTHLHVALHEHQHACADGPARLDNFLDKRGQRLEDMFEREKQRQAANQVSIGNCVTSLRLLSALDWPRFFERASLLEAKLRNDPSGFYPRQDFATRDRYRQVVERLARGSGVGELQVAETILHFASSPAPTDPPAIARHVGYYLIDKGLNRLEKHLGYRRPPHAWLRHMVLTCPAVWYFGWIALLAAGILTIMAATCGLLGAGIIIAALMVLLALAPAAAVAMHWANTLSALVVRPRTLPRLDFSLGVPADCATFVVIPSLLPNPRSGTALAERLEIHYLSNPDENLYFALLTDFVDAEAETMPDDGACLHAAEEGIRALNAKYCPSGPQRFFLFHRRRTWNPSQGCWMGWERKRGKLAEFNRILRGGRDGNFQLPAGPLNLPSIRFVLTLDTDTQLPRETARRLIATLAHPLNEPVFDASRRRVVRGYGVLQPRIGLSLRGAHKSLFARVFAGSVGLDPYTTAVSDTYQDLFASGSFAGKGIYHVDAFEAATQGAFPDNTILSHDLIEGNYVRCALVTDVELLDDFPPSYLAYARREHRWVRGDWQILRWLFRRVPTRQGAKVANPLPLLERWKILDNLRRSLVAPCLVALLLLGWFIWPETAWRWSAFAAVVVGWPAFSSFFTVPWRLAQHWLLRSFGPLLSADFVFTAGQVLLSGIFLLDQARSMLDAIARTLLRCFGTRRLLLEWETASATERRLGAGIGPLASMMWPIPLVTIVIAAALAWWRPDALPGAAPWLIAWLLSPVIAYLVSRSRVSQVEPLRLEEQKELRLLARRTWSFFETYVGAEDHWLPPDNYQEDPKDEVAHRTSPTNIGLYLLSCSIAHEFGYLSLASLLDRLEKSFATLQSLEKNEGHFFNWYDTQTLAPLIPRYLSTVDSGNLAACLMTLKQNLLAKIHAPVLGPAVIQGIHDTLAQTVASATSIRAGSPFQETHDKFRVLLQNMPTALEQGDAWWQSLEQAVARMKQTLGDPGTHAESGGIHVWVRRLENLVHARHGEWSMIAKHADSAPAGLNAHPDSVSAHHLANHEDDGERAWAMNLRQRCEHLAAQASEFAAAMNFKVLYNRDRHLFAVGFNLSTGQLDNAHYDLLASEACLTSFLAIARGDVPRRHWFQLGRPMTRVGGDLTLLSWGGTMFEYLMPRLMLRCQDDTLLDESQHAAVSVQIRYGRKTGVPWGMSESAFNAVDGHMTYQYQSFGVPWLGLKRGLGSDLVVAPYATGLAVMTHPRQALANFHRLRADGAEGAFGFFEAIDFNGERRSGEARGVVVRCYMAHHQGMLFLGLANCLLDNIVQRHFHAEPMVRAAELLLQERIPWDAPQAEAPPRVSAPLTAFQETAQVSRRVATPHTVLPRTHMLASSQYSVWVTNAGSGQSTARGLAVTRWREDATCEAWGQFFYIRDLRSGKTWSAGYQPVCREADDYEVTFAIDKVDFRRLDDGISTHTEITVSPENHAEVRRITFTNHGRQSRYLQITSYSEIVLAPHAADLAHPAFGKLFVETEFIPETDTLLARRRPRSAEQTPLWALHVLAADGATFGNLEFETDRAQFLGRGRTVAAPQALDAEVKLTGTAGPVLDPMFSLRRQFRIKAGASVSLAFTTALAGSREEALDLADHYHDFQGVHRAFDLAWAHSQVELRQLRVSSVEMHLFQRLAAHVIYSGSVARAPAAILAGNRLRQSDLWRLGLSGDLPIVLVRIAAPEEVPLVRQLIAAHTFWRLKGLSADLVILNEYEASYLEELHQQLQDLVRASDERGLEEKSGGIHLRKASHISADDARLLQAVAHVVLAGRNGLLNHQLDRLERLLPALAASQPARRIVQQDVRTDVIRTAPVQLQFDNGIGGFTADGKEYVIRVKAEGDHYRTAPQPWINVLANADFGCLISETGGGCTWAGNSQMNRLTPWNNDPVSDPPGEVVYVRDDENGEFWSATPLPSPTLSPVDFLVRHGQGYSVFEHQRNGLSIQLAMFVPVKEPVKIMRLKVRNLSSTPRRLSAVYFAEWVLGTTRDRTLRNVVTEMDQASGALLARNALNNDFGARIAFADVNLRPRSFSGDRSDFLGRNGNHRTPLALQSGSLSGKVGSALDPCAALQAAMTLRPREEKEIVFVLGEAANIEEVQRLAATYRDGANVEAAWQEVRRSWDDILGAVTIQTPNKALDLLMNRWLLYQVLCCRIWARSALYQSGGAYGFRDQLQDGMAIVYARPAETRAHLLRAAGRQFPEGDVQHWWHPPSGAGVRTRFSDDLLWLPFAVHQYVAVTGDTGVLDERAPFLQAPVLRPDQEEDYRVPETSEETESLYGHCLRAIDHALRFGAHGLPLMGTGDWNDGMNRVGSGGKGESVWTGFFLVTVLERFVTICEARHDDERARQFRDHAQQLRTNLAAHGWDGQWYRRAYFDDGTPLGSAQNDACRIDSIVQSWAVISGATDLERAGQAMAAVNEQLVRRDDGLVLLLAPPFDKTALEPGYIKGYLPGIRENGGQYTHAALWVVQAFAELGQGDRAEELLNMLNPIQRTSGAEGLRKFRLEPYVVPADIDSQPPHAGRGGWSWYTGSAGWFYRVVLETFLGVEVRAGRLRLKPRIPRTWPGFSIVLRMGASKYRISLTIADGEDFVSLDGQQVIGGEIILRDDKQDHDIVIRHGGQ